MAAKSEARRSLHTLPVIAGHSRQGRRRFARLCPGNPFSSRKLSKTLRRQARRHDEGDNIVLHHENEGTATVTIADVKHSNGVIHVIDRVLLPK
jgi:hypothetical protein